jgi:rod shape-determining protein MreC
MRGRKFLPLVFLVLVGAVLITYQARNGPIKNPTAPISSLIYSVADRLTSVKTFFGSLAVRRARLKELEKENALLELKSDRLEEVARENRRLRELLGLKEHTPSYVASARVIARGAGRWANTFTIDAGEEAGIEKDMTAVSPAGLAGKVIKTGPGYSLVLLIDDVRFSAAVRVESSRQEAILSGTGLNFCMLKYVSQDIDIKKGEVLITSGLDGIFPAGIKVGYVSNVYPGQGFFKKVDVRPYADPSRLEEVMLIRK